MHVFFNIDANTGSVVPLCKGPPEGPMHEPTQVCKQLQLGHPIVPILFA